MHILKKLKKLNNRGAGLVTAIVAIALITVLASTLLGISYMNYKMKVTNSNSKDAFYSAETALDEINMGLQAVVSKAVSTAYSQVMTNYSTIAKESDKNALMESEYYNYITNALYDTSDPTYGHYSVSILQSYLKTQAWNSTEEYGCVVSADGDDNRMITYSQTGIVLKNVKVYCKDQKGYTSIITTDIRLSFPTIDFTAVSALPEILGYSVISDSNVLVKSSAGRSTNVLGSVYGDSISVVGTGATSAVNFMSIADYESGADLTNYIISKKNIEMQSAEVAYGANSELWTSSLFVKSSAVTLDGFEYLSNDINLSGTKPSVKITNNLYGYGISTSDADNSSAILINGTNATLDFSEAKSISIAGRAFVSTKKKNEAFVNAAGASTYTGVVSDAKNVEMGESISIKSNQLIYLVPGECIGVLTTNGKALYGTNPMTASQYEDMMSKVNAGLAKEVDDKIEVAKLDSHKLEEYIKKASTPTESGEYLPLVEKLFVQSNGDTLVYYYMTFKDDNLANSYFKLYYNTNEKWVTNYLKYYTEIIKAPNDSSRATIRLSGYGLTYDGTDSELYSKVNLDLTDSVGRKTSNNFANTMNYLCTKLTKELTESEETDLTRDIVFENLIDVDKLKDACAEHVAEESVCKFFNDDCIAIMVDNSVGGTYGTFKYDSDLKLKAYMTGEADANEYKRIHCIIATGDVEIAKDFSGIIICNGSVTVKEGVKVSANVENAREALRLTDADGKSIYQYFVDGASITSSYATGMMDVGDLIRYENWTKQ